MAEDRKLSTLPAADALDMSALTYVVQAPSSDPSSRKVTLAELSAAFLGGGAFQAYSPLLSSIAGQAMVTDRLIYGAGANTVALATLTAAGRALLDDADAATQRTTLGLGSMATQAAGAVAITGGSLSGINDLAVADGGTGASSASAARSNLGLSIGSDIQVHDADLDALAANGANGLWARTGAGTGAARTITGTSNQLSVANGDGASGNPTLSIPTNPVFPGYVTSGAFVPTATATNGLGLKGGNNPALYANSAEVVNWTNTAFSFTLSGNSGTGLDLRNTSNGAAAYVGVNFRNDTPTNNQVFATGAGSSLGTGFTADTLTFYSNNTGGFLFYQGANVPLVVRLNNAEQFRLTSAAATFTPPVTAAAFTPTTTVANGLGLAGANNPAIYANATKVLDCTSAGASVTGTLAVSGAATVAGGLVSGRGVISTANGVTNTLFAWPGTIGDWATVHAWMPGYTNSNRIARLYRSNGGLFILDQVGGDASLTFVVSGSNIQCTNNNPATQDVTWSYVLYKL